MGLRRDTKDVEIFVAFKRISIYKSRSRSFLERTNASPKLYCRYCIALTGMIAIFKNLKCIKIDKLSRVLRC